MLGLEMLYNNFDGGYPEAVITSYMPYSLRPLQPAPRSDTPGEVGEAQDGSGSKIDCIIRGRRCPWSITDGEGQLADREVTEVTKWSLHVKATRKMAE